MFKFDRYDWNYTTNPYPKYNDYIDYVDSLLLPLNFKKEIIGKSADGQFNIYAYSKDLDKPVYWIDGTVHGSEWQSSYFPLDFIVEVWGDKHHNKLLTKAIRDNFGIHYIPSVSPYGFENVTYTNANGVNINRQFDNYWEKADANLEPFNPNYKGTSVLSESEAKAFVNEFDKIKPYMVANCHTTFGEASGMTIQRRHTHYLIQSMDAMNSLRLTYNEIGTTEWSSQYGPTIAGWCATQTSKEGTPVYSTVLESQGNTDKVNVGIPALYIIAITMINWKNNGKMITNSINDILS